jgi:hypothetical protein
MNAARDECNDSTPKNTAPIAATPKASASGVHAGYEWRDLEPLLDEQHHDQVGEIGEEEKE